MTLLDSCMSLLELWNASRWSNKSNSASLSTEKSNALLKYLAVSLCFSYLFKRGKSSETKGQEEHVIICSLLSIKHKT